QSEEGPWSRRGAFARSISVVSVTDVGLALAVQDTYVSFAKKIVVPYRNRARREEKIDREQIDRIWR
ncbi:hypothetical protein ABTL69_19330, partial [Acinetobacter baumannii]